MEWYDDHTKRSAVQIWHTRPASWPIRREAAESDGVAKPQNIACLWHMFTDYPIKICPNFLFALFHLDGA
jgi:hypothetical protein